MKVGRSEAARAATVSHTASLAGSDAASGAFLRRLGIARVDTIPSFLEALIRRGRTQPDPELRLGKLRLDTVGKRAWLGEEPLDLTAREWAALEFLVSRANRIVSKEQIMQSLYSWDEDITPNAIEKFISRLRVKLETGGISIRTVRGLGYYLEKPKDEEGADAASDDPPA